MSTTSMTGAEAVDAYAALHYGVKGMQWGVRKDDSGGSSLGKHKKPEPEKSPEAKAAQAAKAKAKKSGTTDVLTNKELQDFVTRMNLEQQYGRLNKKQTSPGAKWVQDTLKEYGKQELKNVGIKTVKKATLEGLAYALGPFGVAVPR